jgi:methionyl-tRNA formyltransferase
MNIIIITQQDPIYLPIFFKNFFEIYKQEDKEINIKGIMIQEPLGEESISTLIKQIYNFYGPLDFLKQSINYIKTKTNHLLYKLNLKNKILYIPALAKENNIPILEESDANSKRFITFLENKNIQLVVSVSATQIFERKLLETPEYGCINIHCAPLPRYRGMMPNFWQMYHDEEYSVLTIHKMVKELDKGAIIHQEKTKIEKNMTLHELVCQTKVNASKALWKVLNQFLTGKVNYKPLPKVEGSYFSFPTKEDVKKFRMKGKRLL